MKRIFVIAMLMFTVLACSSGPSQKEFDELTQQNQLLINELNTLSQQIHELNKLKLADFIVTRKELTGTVNGRVYYLVGDSETATVDVGKYSQCYKDAVIGSPLPLSCRS
jgi:hypothetical protein